MTNRSWQASRTTENKKAKLASEGPQERMTDSEKACLAIGAIAIIAVIAAAVFDDDEDEGPQRRRLFTKRL